MRPIEFLEKLILFLFPKWLLHGTPWKKLWEDKETKELKKTLSVFFSITAIGYIAHYYIVDINLVSSSDSFWIQYRFFLSGFSGLLFFVSRKLNSKFLLNSTILIFGLIATYLQTLSMLKSELVPYFWSFAIPSIIVSISSIHILASSAYLTVCYLTVWPILVASGTSPNLLYGTSIVSFGLLFIHKKTIKDKIEGFISQQNLFEVEKELVESQKDLTNNILRIFPRKHKNDLLQMIKEKGLNPLQAMDEILMQKEKTIACIFTDIRGYTKSSKDLSFVSHRAIPNIKNITHILENNNGIPSFVGDLVFSYFDDDRFKNNVVDSLSSSIEILEYNLLFNEKNSEKISRYIILDCGNAIVGNIGGVDSSIEVTAMGTPPNRCSRIDEITKNPSIQDKLSECAVVFSSSFMKAITQHIGQVNFRKIDLIGNQINIRDFPEIKEIFYINKQDLDEKTLTKAS